MVDQVPLRLVLYVQSEFGSIYREGEFVQRGSILGLAVDAHKVVVAPVSGWVRLPTGSDGADGLHVEIWRQPPDPEQPPAP